MTAAREAPNVRGGVAPNVSRTQEAADAPMCPHQITVAVMTDAEAEILHRLAVLVAESLKPDQRAAALVVLTRVQRAVGFHLETLRMMRG